MNYGWLSLLPPIIAVVLAVAALVIVVFVWNKKRGILSQLIPFVP